MNPLKSQKRKVKSSIARATGIPTTKSGRSKKADRVQNHAIGWLVVVGIVVYLLSCGSEAATAPEQSWFNKSLQLTAFSVG